MSGIVDKYKEEFDKDCEIDRITLMNRKELISQITNKWAFRVYQHKTVMAKLQDRKIDLLIEAEITLEDSNDNRYKSLKSKAAKDNFILRTDTVREIERSINKEQRVVEFLEEIVTNCKWIFSKQLESIVELLKLEGA